MSTADTVSPEEIERTRKLRARNESELLRNIARVTQTRAAARLGVHPSTINRRLDELKEACETLSAFGLQINPVNSLTVTRTELTALESLAHRYLDIRIQERSEEI